MSVNGSLKISIDSWCPQCDKLIDLISIDELRDDGWIYELVMPNDKPWSGACEDFSKGYLEAFGTEFKCPHCDKIVYIKNILY